MKGIVCCTAYLLVWWLFTSLYVCLVFILFLGLGSIRVEKKNLCFEKLTPGAHFHWRERDRSQTSGKQGPRVDRIDESRIRGGHSAISYLYSKGLLLQTFLDFWSSFCGGEGAIFPVGFPDSEFTKKPHNIWKKPFSVVFFFLIFFFEISGL